MVGAGVVVVEEAVAVVVGVGAAVGVFEAVAILGFVRAAVAVALGMSGRRRSGASGGEQEQEGEVAHEQSGYRRGLAVT